MPNKNYTKSNFTRNNNRQTGDYRRVNTCRQTTQRVDKETSQVSENLNQNKEQIVSKSDQIVSTNKDVPKNRIVWTGYVQLEDIYPKSTKMKRPIWSYPNILLEEKLGGWDVDFLR